MSGAAKIAADNDVCLPNGRTIRIAGALTAESPVAIITPAQYISGTPVLRAGTGVTLTQELCGKFAVTPQSDGTQWRIDASGTLQER